MTAAVAAVKSPWHHRIDVRLAVLLVAIAGAMTACTRGIEEAGGVLTSPPAPASSALTSSPSLVASPTGRPAIVVNSPRPGDELLSPVTVRGTADVFEAAVSIRIVDASGQELAAINTQASCGTGCRGRYLATLAFFTPSRQLGAVEVFEVSPADGSVQHLVSVPVTLVPGS